MPTMTIDSTALPRVRRAGSRPAENQIAAVMSMPLPLDKRPSMICPASVTTPALSSTRMCPQGPARAAASSSVPGPGHIRCCTTPSRRVSAAAPMPVAIPVSSTASQNRTAPGCTSVAGTRLRSEAVACDRSNPSTPCRLALDPTGVARCQHPRAFMPLRGMFLQRVAWR